MSMGSSRGGRVDQATWDKLVEAYRQDPGNHSLASRLASVQRRTARRAYESGYPDRPWGVKSIRALIMEDAELGRARAQLEAERIDLESDQRLLDSERDREAARQHAARAKTEEALLVSGARAAAMRGYAAAIEAANGMRAAMRRLGDDLTRVSDGAATLSDKERAFLSSSSRRYASILRDLAVAGRTAMEMERLFLGEPTEIVKLTTDLDDAPVSELVRMAGYADEVLRRAAARGVVELPGVSPPPPKGDAN